MKFWPTLIAILLILSLAGGGIAALIFLKPEAPKEERKKAVVGIEVMEVEKKDVKLTIGSQGLVEPVVETMATSEVGGKVKSVAKSFQAGGEFRAGDVLVTLDDTDYKAALAQALAEEAAASLDLKLEESRQAQAERDWKDLGGDREQSELAKREPQIKAAEARLAAATQAVLKAEKDIERTKLVALYDGRVRSKMVGLGAFVTPGARLADIYATGAYEIRLPVSLDEFSLVDLNAPGDAVTLRTQVGNESQEWKAKILRTEGEVDRASRSVFVVVGLEKKGGFSREDVMAPNLFVKAEVPGKTLTNVVKVPRKAFVDTEKVLVLDKEYKLHTRKVKVVHEEPDDLYVKEGLQNGDKICITALAAVTEGMEVRVISEDEEKEKTKGEGEGEEPEVDGGSVATDGVEP